MRSAVLLLALAATVAAAADATRKEDVGLRYEVPVSWTRVPAPSDMRAAQYRIPRAEGDAEDAELVLFFFGTGQGGSAEDNLERWHGQLRQPDGRPSRDAGVITIRTVHGLRVTSLDLPGTYAPPPTLGRGGGEEPGWHLLAAVIEGEGGPWFFRAIGPQATIARAKDHFERMLGSVQAHR